MPRRKSTQETFDKNVKKLTKSSDKNVVRKTKPKVKVPPLPPNHLHNTKRLRDYKPDETLFALRSYYKTQTEQEDRNGFYVGSIIYRSLSDMEQKVNFYLDNVTNKTKKEIKANLIKDLDSLKKRIKSL
tara:strand:+ start:1675 stop:2061 length:387 start_codon:yes stop_codon:yes gene_type:complete